MNDNLEAMIQRPAPNYETIEIPINKLLLFRTESNKNNPEGRSILRNAYRDWYFKKRIQEIEGIGIERDLAGFPVLTAPEGMDIWNPSDPDMVRNYASALKIVQGLRRDSLEGIVLPADWKLELLSSESKRNFDTNQIIERYDGRIAMTVLADFIVLGHQNVGSFALSSDKTKLFATAIGAYLNIICEVFNRKAIPDLIDINGEYFNGITDYPHLIHGDIEDADIEALANFVSKTISCGAIIPDEQLEKHLRMIANLPDKIDNWTTTRAQNQSKVRPEENQEDIDDDDDEKKATAAKKTLGRSE